MIANFPVNKVAVVDYSEAGLEKSLQGSIGRLHTTKIKSIRLHDIDQHEERKREFFEKNGDAFLRELKARKGCTIDQVSLGFNCSEVGETHYFPKI